MASKKLYEISINGRIEKPTLDGSAVIIDYGGMSYVEMHQVDAVEVVRCKDCKHGEVDDPDDFPNQHYCHCGCGWNDANFFCSSGERKDNDST